MIWNLTSYFILRFEHSKAYFEVNCHLFHYHNLFQPSQFMPSADSRRITKWKQIWEYKSRFEALKKQCHTAIHGIKKWVLGLLITCHSMPCLATGMALFFTTQLRLLTLHIIFWHQTFRVHLFTLNLIHRNFNLIYCNFNLIYRNFSLIFRNFNLIFCNFNLIYCDFQSEVQKWEVTIRLNRI